MRLGQRFSKVAILASSLAGFAACATTSKPPELVNAEMAYNRAAEGPANEFVPDELHKAKTALDGAETAFNKDPDSQVTRDMAYIAQRKAQTAEAKGQTEQSSRAKTTADVRYKQTLTEQNEQAKKDVALNKEQAAEAERQRNAATLRAGAAEMNAASEKLAREESDRVAKAAMEDLAKIAQLREEERGLVITLSGDVIFQTDKADLLPSAQVRLNQLADTLNKGSGHLLIEGHTDSRGSDDHNQDLSFRRASAVRNYLISRGVAADRIEANGYGKTRPIADNAAAEGRAMNRRVEIVVQHAMIPARSSVK